MTFLFRRSVFIFGALWALLVLAVSAEDAKPDIIPATDRWTTLPVSEIEPSFTTAARQVFTCDLTEIGREAVKLSRVTLNGVALKPGSGYKVVLGRLRITPRRDLAVGLNRIGLVYEHPLDDKHKANPGRHEFWVNYQPASAKISFTKRGEMVVDGQSQLALCSYRSGPTDNFTEGFADLKAAGFNVVHEYWFEGSSRVLDSRASLKEWKRRACEYLDAAQENGLGVFLGLPRRLVRIPNEANQRTCADIICSLSSHPALRFWYLADEPKNNYGKTEEDTLHPLDLAIMGHLARRLDPNHPAIILFNDRISLRTMASYCSLLWYDCYPFPARGRKVSSIAPILASLNISRQWTDKPVWAVLQAHDGSPLYRKEYPTTDESYRPNVAEIRAEAHAAIAAGCGGMAFYWLKTSAFNYPQQAPATWAGFMETVRELRRLEPVLLSQEPIPALKFGGGSTKVTCWARRYEGKTWLGLVNVDCKSAAGDLAVTLPEDAGAVETVIKSAATVDSSGKKLVVKLDKAGVAVVSF